MPSLVLRYFGDEQEDDRLLVLNLGTGLDAEPCPEPLLAPIPGKNWRLLLSSDQVQTALVLTSQEEKKA
jgi:maltooligosyltrehalose trehalohydrolase